MIQFSTDAKGEVRPWVPLTWEIWSKGRSSFLLISSCALEWLCLAKQVDTPSFAIAAAEQMASRTSDALAAMSSASTVLHDGLS